MQADILSDIKRMTKVRDVIVLTHNIDFIFLQTMLLGALKRCGHPSLTVFADAQCVQESFERQSLVVKDLGSRYRVIPVTMSPGFRFHPKAILVLGDENSYLYTGSGNLTFGGYRENSEIWNKFELRESVPPEFSSFKEYLSELLPFVGLSELVEKDLSDIFNEERYSWLKDMPSGNGLWFQPSKLPSLLDRIASRLAEQSVKKIHVCTPFFDEKANALMRLSQRFGNPPIQLYIQSKRSTLLQTAAENLSSNISIISVQAKKGVDASNRFVHAKWFGFEIGESVEVFSGSANCSNAATLFSGNKGNAELMAETSVSIDYFNNEIMNEFVLLNEKPELIDSHEIDDSNDTTTRCIKLNAARYDYGKLIISYQCDESITLTKLKLDNEIISLELGSVKNGVVSQAVSAKPKQLRLIGDYESNPVISNSLWVDDESLLRSNSTSRQLVEAIQQINDASEDDPRRWVMLFNLLSQNIQLRTASENQRSAINKGTENNPVKFSVSLLTNKSYTDGLAIPSINLDSNNKSQSIYSLLLNSFGLLSNDPAQDDNYSFGNLEDDSQVDIPEATPKSNSAKKQKSLSKSQEKKLLISVSEIIDEICGSDFILVRDVKQLARDLQVIALLIRKLYSLSWLDENQFFKFTHRVWSQLFFTSNIDQAKGLLQMRYELEEDKQQFVSEFASYELVASLLAWFSAAKVDYKDVYGYRFLLSQTLAMGRCPWLWHLSESEIEKAAKQLFRIWQDSTCLWQSTEHLSEELNVFMQSLKVMSIEGIALAHFEVEMSAHNLSDVRQSLENIHVKSGDIIWQARASFCVVLEGSEGKKQVKVLKLQSPERINEFQVNMIVPLQYCLSQKALFSDLFFTHYKPVLEGFLSKAKLSALK